MKGNRNQIAAVLAAIIVIVCANTLSWHNSATAQQPPSSPKTVVFNFTSGSDNVFQIESGFHVAEDALNSGRRVVLFFNGRGVTIPVRRLSPDLRLGDERALWLILRDLINRGAEVLVARDSARLLNMEDGEFIPEAYLGVNVFQKMPDDTVVFTY